MVAGFTVPVTARSVCGPVPVPLKVTLCGLPPALSVMVMAPDSGASAEGVNVTVRVQNEPAPRVAGQLSLSAKSVLGTMEVMVSAALPELVKSTDCGALVSPMGKLPNDKEEGDNCTWGPEPTPVSETFWVPALLNTVMEPFRVPAEAGVKVTLMVQLTVAASEDGQLLIWANSALAVMEEISNALVPELVKVMGNEELLVPRLMVPKFRLGGLKVTAGPRPIPLSATWCGLAAVLS